MLVFWWQGRLSSLPILRLHMSQICTSESVELIMWCHVIQVYVMQSSNPSRLWTDQYWNNPWSGLLVWNSIYRYKVCHFYGKCVADFVTVTLFFCPVPQYGCRLLHTSHWPTGIRYDAIFMWVATWCVWMVMCTELCVVQLHEVVLLHKLVIVLNLLVANLMKN